MFAALGRIYEGLPSPAVFGTHLILYSSDGRMSTPKYTFSPKILGEWGRGLLLSPVLHQMSFAVLILTPGPMVEAATQLRTYWPLAAAGLALMMAPIRAL